jgi:hypothetical protein
MNQQPQAPDMQILATALEDLRDTWTLLSLALKDMMCEVPSSTRDEVLALAQRQLAKVKLGERGFAD